MKRVLAIVLLLGAWGMSWAQAPAQSTLNIPPGGVAPQPLADPSAPLPPPTRSRVLLAERPTVVDRFNIHPAAVADLWQDALLHFTRQMTPAAAWKALGVTPADTVGIKVCTNGSDLMSTRPALVDAIARSLVAAGVPPSQIVVWDRNRQTLDGTTYGNPPPGAPYGVKAVVPDTGFDPKVFYVNEIIGRLIWGDLLFRGKTTRDKLLQQADASVDQSLGQKEAQANAGEMKQEMADQTSNRSYFARLVTQTCTKLVNVPVMIDNPNLGLDGCLANLAVDSVDNNRRFQEDSNGDPAVSEILDRDLFRKKVVLHVMDGIVAEYAGGPSLNPANTQSIGALYLSTDPVAIDSLVLQRMETWRAEAKVVPIGELAKHIRGARDAGLGFSDPKRIELVKIP